MGSGECKDMYRPGLTCQLLERGQRVGWNVNLQKEGKEVEVGYDADKAHENSKEQRKGI